jgi:putative glutathione S-transferase
MGLLVDGVWHDQWYDTKSTGGRFKRQDSAFRDAVTADGSSGFKAEADRYHLYVSLACPWAHRTLVFRKLKKLEHILPVSVVDWEMMENGWTFSETNTDNQFNSDFMHQIYTRAKSDYTGRVTVPVLWDKQKNTIVNNESSELLRMLNTEFNAFTDVAHDFYPEHLREEIDVINESVYHKVNNGVYKSGFATTQEAYEEAVTVLFDELDRLETLLETRDWLAGDHLTEADIRLFTCLVRFDPVYHGHFKCNIRMLKDYPNLWDHTRTIYQIAGVAETVDFTHIKGHYYYSHRTINPTGIIPVGPGSVVDHMAPTKRAVPVIA